MAAGRKILCPTFVLWASNYLDTSLASPSTSGATGAPGSAAATCISGHFIAEENPKDALASCPFLLSHKDD